MDRNKINELKEIKKEIEDYQRKIEELQRKLATKEKDPKIEQYQKEYDEHIKNFNLYQQQMRGITPEKELQNKIEAELAAKQKAIKAKNNLETEIKRDKIKLDYALKEQQNLYNVIYKELSPKGKEELDKNTK
ncbi:hypothetical protein HGD80_00690 [Paulownia witches'-broom phytoplasma]|uniref:Uncharacterized protein n=1 Tax=Paulownia witches'-broom phytoplasma TaxID=39647 RepID=A0ABX8TP59_9MOLU|nr:hypothetical protein [Paulownia witches'-broom phytoplasma]QYC31136.1 hypothetical protein HGD80_00690 [Paulownia witches'-broom phytoplasma]GLH60351.1 hypothetical protein PAWBP_0890 [Paulownia witches'-broom phytoplasma]